MTTQDFSVKITTNNLGVTSVTDIVRPIVIGRFTGLTPGAITALNGGNIASAGIGQGAELAQQILNDEMSQVDVYPIVPSSDTGATGGYVSTFSLAGNISGLSSGSVLPTVAIDSTLKEVDNYLLRLEIVSGGATSVTVRYSIDDGNSWVYQTVVTVATAFTIYAKGAGTAYAVDSGLRVTLPTGTWITGDVFNAYTFATFATISAVSAGDGSIEDAYNQISAGPKKYSHIIIAGTPNGGTTPTDSANSVAFATLLALVKTKTELLDSFSNIPTVSVLQFPRKVNLGNELDTVFQALALGQTATQSYRIAIGYGYFLQQSNLQKGSAWRSVSWLAINRICQNKDPSDSIFTSDTLPVVSPDLTIKFQNLSYTGILKLGSTYDESLSVNVSGVHGAVTPAGYLAIYRSNNNSDMNGFTFLEGNTHTDPTNDFFELVYITQFNELERVIDSYMWNVYKGQELKTRMDGTGALTDSQAKSINLAVSQEVINKLASPGFIPYNPNGQEYITIDQTINMIATKKIRWTFRMWVDAYAKYFEAVGGLSL
jgi:hypothetical protein